MTSPPPLDLPTLAPGVTHLETDNPRSGSLHRLTLATVAARAGDAYWVDTGSAATTYAFAEWINTTRPLTSIHVARAFTAYQHHTLVHEVRTHVDDDTAIIVFPCLSALYADDDVPTAEAEVLFEDILAELEELVTTFDVPVLMTAHAGPFAERAARRADRTITARETDLGTAFATESFQTTVYRGPGFWQTTIPYWVELFGHVDEMAMVDPVRPTPLSAHG